MQANAPPASNPGDLLCGSGHRHMATPVTRTAYVILDFGREMSGPLEIEVGQGTGSGTVEVSYSESLRYLAPQKCDDLGIEQIAPPPGYYVPPCPRNITLTGGEQRWRDAHPRSGFRYVLLTVRPRPGSTVYLQSARVVDYAPLPQYRSLQAKNVYRGWFLSSDAALDEYWFDGAYTAQVDTVAAGRAGLFYEGIPRTDTVGARDRGRRQARSLHLV